MKRYRLAFVMLAGGLAACGHEDSLPPTPQPDESAGYEVALESVQAVVPVDGSVQGVNRAVVSTRLMARVTDVAVEIGARVREGDVLARLGVEDVMAHRGRAEAAVRAARAAEDEAGRHLARMDTLLTRDAVARVQVDQARLQFTQASAQRAMAEAALQEVEATSSYATIRAPFDGAVVQRSAQPGDLAAPGMPLFVIEGSGAREAVLNVPLEAAAKLGTGATVAVRAQGGREAAAPVRAVAAGADPVTRTVEVRVTVPRDWPTGMAVTALVPVGLREGIAIPEGAVVRRGQLTGVRVLTADGPVLRWVRLGRTVVAGADEAPRVEVLSGLRAGERIEL